MTNPQALEALRQAFEQECADADALLRYFGLDPEQCRTEGGSLNLPRIKTLTTEFHWQGEDANGNPVGLPVRFVRLATQPAPKPEAQASPAPFQQRVQPWLLHCFGAEIAGDKVERNHRFLEESLELVQACGCTQSEAHQMVDYVFGRPVGEPGQEAGGVMVTLAALCLAQALDMHAAGETELARIWPLADKIRAKQAAKPKHSPLPEQPASQPPRRLPVIPQPRREGEY